MKLIKLPTTNEGAGNARLYFAHVAFYVASASVAWLQFRAEPVVASLVAVAFFTICTVLYMFKSLTGFKVDLDDKEIELSSNFEEKTEK